MWEDSRTRDNGRQLNSFKGEKNILHPIGPEGNYISNAIHYNACYTIHISHSNLEQSRIFDTRGAESESESPGVVATSQESESTKLPRLRLRNASFESVI